MTTNSPNPNRRVNAMLVRLEFSRFPQRLVSLSHQWPYHTVAPWMEYMNDVVSRAIQEHMEMTLFWPYDVCNEVRLLPISWMDIYQRAIDLWIERLVANRRYLMVGYEIMIRVLDGDRMPGAPARCEFPDPGHLLEHSYLQYQFAPAPPEYEITANNIVVWVPQDNPFLPGRRQSIQPPVAPAKPPLVFPP